MNFLKGEVVIISSYSKGTFSVECEDGVVECRLLDNSNWDHLYDFMTPNLKIELRVVNEVDGIYTVEIMN